MAHVRRDDDYDDDENTFFEKRRVRGLVWG